MSRVGPEFVSSLFAVSVVLPALGLVVLAGFPAYYADSGVCVAGWSRFQVECQTQLTIVVCLALWVAGAALTWTLLVLKGSFERVYLRVQVVEPGVVSGLSDTKY